jgi:hypothetical protein
MVVYDSTAEDGLAGRMNIEGILARLEQVRPSGGGWIARCPAHEDRKPSLSIRECDRKILFGRRIYKSSSFRTSIYAYDGDKLIEETNAVGSVVARYSQGLNIDEPLAMLRSGAPAFIKQAG